MLLNSLLVAIGGCFGAISRFAVSNWMRKHASGRFPYGTLLVNLLGSFLLGLIGGHGWHPAIVLLFGTGFMGAFTTFSTFKLETLQLGLQKEWGVALLYLGVSYTAGILLAVVGFAVGS